MTSLPFSPADAAFVAASNEPLVSDVAADPLAGITGPAAIWAQDQNGVIGDGPNMAWHVPGDFAHFKRTTWGGALVMGRRTFEGLPGVLSGRDMVIVSRSGVVDRQRFDERVTARGLDATLTVVPSLEEALEQAEVLAARRGGRLWIAGGGQIYRACLDKVEACVVSRLDLVVPPSPGLVYAPALDSGWELLPGSDEDWRVEENAPHWRVDYLRRAR
ncbi:MAG: dihydrofolate reductase [Buchananella hordeovulneris]|nr:dihydrofolate reductase [Buchananella hordeovulneris]